MIELFFCLQRPWNLKMRTIGNDFYRLSKSKPANAILVPIAFSSNGRSGNFAHFANTTEPLVLAYSKYDCRWSLRPTCRLTALWDTSDLEIIRDFLSILFYYLCFVFVFVTLFCLFLATLWSPTRNGLTSWLYCVWCFLVFCHFPIWCPVSSVVLGCIDSWYLHSSLFCAYWHWVSFEISYFWRENTKVLPYIRDVVMDVITFLSNLLHGVISLQDARCRVKSI